MFDITQSGMTKILPRDIASRIDKLQNEYVVATTLFQIVHLENRHTILFSALGLDQGSICRLGRQGNTYYASDVYAALNSIKNVPSNNLEYLGSALNAIIIWIGNDLSQHDYFEKTQELEFFRHIRNAAAHGNRFYFKTGEPRRNATFKEFKIERRLQGEPFLFEFMSTGDVFDLLDHIKSYLINL